MVDNINRLREAYCATRKERPSKTIAAVVLPGHLYVICQLPGNAGGYPTRWRMLKSRFPHALANKEEIKQSRLQKGEHGIWQRRHWEHTIRDETDLRRHIDYIHYNPLKHGWREIATE